MMNVTEEPTKKWTKQRGQEEQTSWTWEDILDGKGSWTWEEVMAGKDRLPWEQTESAREHQRRLRGSQPRCKHERQPQKFLGGRHTGWLAEPGFRPEPTPHTRFKERVTIQAPCYAVIRTVSPVFIHSSVPAPRTCRAKMSI
jgi:hypothetical protein